MKAWVLKTRNRKYIDSLDEITDVKLDRATLWPTRKSALSEGLVWFDDFYVDSSDKDSLKIKAVKVEIKEIK